MRRTPIYVRLAGSSQETPLTRVLFVAGTVPPAPCGVGDYTFKLAESLDSMDEVETAILTGVDARVAEETSGVSIFPVLRSWRLREAGHVIRFLRFWKPDIVHVQYPTQGYGRGLLPYIVPLTARILGVRSVQTWHEGFALRQVFKLLFQLSAGSGKVVVRGNFLDLVHPWLRWGLQHCRLSFIASASAIPRANISREALLHERQLLLQGQRRLIVFFGFLYPPKGVELLFEIADPLTDQLVIAGPSESDSPYLAKLKLLASSATWHDKVTFTGFLPPERAAVLLAACDAVILPFRQGGGHWNTSIHSATLNGCFVITTSTDATGYDEQYNVFFARPDDLSEMRRALALYGKRRDDFNLRGDEVRDQWEIIAEKHYRIYRDLLAAGP
jgi:glycosyltransferase involved in cell wall biosynthesis